jgi:hypothetical protein
MNAKLLFLLLSCSCAFQKQIVSEADRVLPVETISHHVFAPSTALDEVSDKQEAPRKERVIQATPMEGPFSTVEDYCEWLFRTSERFNPVMDDNRCEYSSIKNEGEISAQLVFATFNSKEGEYHIALETEEGWFVADSQYLDDLSDAGAGNLYDATLSKKKLTIEDLIPGGSQEVVLRATKKIVHTCNGCEVQTKTIAAHQEQMIVCSVGAEQPSCIALSAPNTEEKRSSLSVLFTAGSLVTGGAILFSSQREAPIQDSYSIIF